MKMKRQPVSGSTTLGRRKFMLAAAVTISAPSTVFGQADKWGGGQGYPTGWAGGFSRNPAYRVGNYSGGYESMVRVRRIGPGKASPLTSAPIDLKFQRKSKWATPKEYADSWPVTGLLIARRGAIWHESYGFDRSPFMRLTSWSMAKSVTSLLLGICLDRGLISSMDDKAERYLPELKGTLHGGCSLRNLANMCSGSEISHDRDNTSYIYPKGFIEPDASIRKVVAGWNTRHEEQGRTFHYNELCPLTIGMVIRQVTGRSMSEFASEALWIPLGAEGDATWMVDSERNEFNCIGFAAQLRDWARLGQLVAQRGAMNGKQIVSDRWIAELTQWTSADRAVRYGAVSSGLQSGYKFFMWHMKPDGSCPAFVGYHGQRVYIDMPTQTVLVQTAVDQEGGWENELYALFDAATKVG